MGDYDITFRMGGNLQQELRRVQARARNLAPAYNRIGKKLVRSVRQNFQESGRPKKWKPLRQPRMKGRSKKAARANRPLIDTGALMQSINHELFYGGLGVGGTLVGSNLVYAATHNYGRKRMWTTGRGGTSWFLPEIPQREFLIVQESDAEEFAQIVEEHLFGGLTDAAGALRAA